ncbi:MAG TPA: S8 family serine peptidase, partial [Candidatus Deferrimicrobium sp.]|nr:S8 family serine peptidase [Candidatus Deferrimicrobium sp.]
MRRSLAALAAAALLLTSVGSATGAEPGASAAPAPVVEPTPSTAPPSSVEPASTEPAPLGDPGPSSDPGAIEDPANHAPTGPDPTASVAPVVEAAVPPGNDRAATRGGPAKADPADPTDRWIVVLEPGTDAASAAGRQGRRMGFAADRVFRNVVRGYAARLDRAQVEALRHDPAVAMIVADERIESEAQLLPTGITRVNANRSVVAKIDGLDERVDADVAIVDTGIASIPDLNVVGGYNCSTADRTAWRDVYGHGTHVAGTVGAIDDGAGVVGVAPGVRLWAVKILDDTGTGLLSWYVCGLDWIAAQRDPSNTSRPLIEAVNMSVAKWGRDDGNCGATNSDILHAAVCRLVASGVTVVAAAGNDSGSAAARVPAAYNEVITVSALADTDGKAGGLGGNRCYSWGSYDRDDTFADFSNFGSDVDLIAPGKCIWSTVPGGYKYSSGTSMATPHVTGAVALLKASRPTLTPAEVREALQYLGTTGWSTSTDPDPYHEHLLDTSRIGPHGDFGLTAGSTGVGEAGGAARIPISVTRSATSFERIRFAVSGLPKGATASFSPASLYGFTATAATLTVSLPFGIALGSYQVTVIGIEHDNVHQSSSTIQVVTDNPTASPPTAVARSKGILGTTATPMTVSWPAGSDPTTGIGGYELQESVDAGAWLTIANTSASVRSASPSQTLGHAYRYRVRARDLVGNWSDWATGPSVTATLVQDRSSALTYTGRWTKSLYSVASGGSTTWATALGARVRMSFSGRGIAMVAPVGPTRGSAAIYVDGVYRGTVSFRASGGRSRVVMYST